MLGELSLLAVDKSLWVLSLLSVDRSDCVLGDEPVDRSLTELLLVELSELGVEAVL